MDVADLPVPQIPAAATGDVNKGKKKRKAKSDEIEASGSKDGLPASPQVCLLRKMIVRLS